MRLLHRLLIVFTIITATITANAEAGRLKQTLPARSGQTEEAKYEVYSQLLPKLQEEGKLRLIVQLDAEFQIEGELPDRAQIQAQQQRIERSQQAVLDRLASSDSSLARRYKHIPFLAVEVDAAGLESLRDSQQVLSFIEDVPSPLILDVSIPLIGADDAWTAGYEGSDWSVAILDTGVDSTHPFLVGKVIDEACFSGAYSPSMSVCPNGLQEQTGSGAGAPCSSAIGGCKHGTHVAGIAAGSGASFSGVGRAANLLAVQVFSRFDDDSYCGDGNSPCVLSWVADQLSGLEWVYDQHGSQKIAAANMSLGSGHFTSICDGSEAARKAAIDSLRAVDIATVVAAGNGYYTDGISAPACVSTAVSVGNTTTSDMVYASSNASSFMSLFAPGSSIISSVPGGGYESWYGTSMAAPHVTGAWAVLKSRAIELTVDQGLNVLQDTGVLVTDTRSGGSVTRPRLQLEAAIDALDPIVGSFADVPPSHWAWGYIEGIYQEGITNGCLSEPLLYCPELEVSRAQMAKFLLIAKHGEGYTPPPGTGIMFADVDASHWAVDWIEQVANEGITSGCAPNLYCPDLPLSRAQMAKFLLLGEHGSGYTPPAGTGSMFADVPAGHAFVDWIEQLAAEGITSGCGGGNYCPDMPVSRAQMAVFLVRAFNVTLP